MGRELADNFACARHVFAEVDDAVGAHVSRTMFSGSEAELNDTATAQPALLAHSIAALRVLESETGLGPVACVMGHSVGEYAALVAGGAFALRDAALVLRARGAAMRDAAMQETQHGGLRSTLAMQALLLAPQHARAPPFDAPTEAARLLAWVDSACEAVQRSSGLVVAAAAVNSPQQVVLSGHAEAVRAAVAALREGHGEDGNAGATQHLRWLVRRAVDLPVSAPFHCALMEPAAARVAAMLGGGTSAAVSLAAPLVPLVAGESAALVRDPCTVREALVRGVTRPVLWAASVHAAAAAAAAPALATPPLRPLREADAEAQGGGGAGGSGTAAPHQARVRFLEVGTGSALSALIRQCLPEGASTLAVGDVAGVRACAAASVALA